MIPNPFDRPAAQPWGPTEPPVATQPPHPWPTAILGVWASPPPAPAIVHPPGAAVDQVTGEVFMKPDGTAWDRDQLLLYWQSTRALLESAKADEMKYRKMVVAVFTSPDVIKGTENIALGNGYMLKTVKAINYKVGSKVKGVSNVSAVKYALDRIGAYVGEGVDVGVGALIADRIVKTSFDLSISEYDKLPPPLKAIIDEVITTTDGAPKVEIVEPKEEE